MQRRLDLGQRTRDDLNIEHRHEHADAHGGEAGPQPDRRRTRRRAYRGNAGGSYRNAGVSRRSREEAEPHTVEAPEHEGARKEERPMKEEPPAGEERAVEEERPTEEAVVAIAEAAVEKSVIAIEAAAHERMDSEPAVKTAAAAAPDDRHEVSFAGSRGRCRRRMKRDGRRHGRPGRGGAERKGEEGGAGDDRWPRPTGNCA
ncbi:MAG TPA: hypothetical protein VGR91_01725 [Stellaceae bacterium]|nr:hypothetical protein [Stellaceae bacterium]